LKDQLQYEECGERQIILELGVLLLSIFAHQHDCAISWPNQHINTACTRQWLSRSLELGETLATPTGDRLPNGTARGESQFR
jgi:hypothetical protein